MKRVVPAAMAICALAGWSLTGCTAEANSPVETVTVFAASSLTDTFTQIADDYEAEHPGVSIRLSFAGSSDLATQIVEGAPADVFASADQAQMQGVADSGLTAAAPVTFATNVPAIAVPPDNPAGIETFADLANPAVATVACAPQVPCGVAEQKLEQATGIHIAPVSEESSVTDVLGKVTTGQADAGVVYVTDVVRAGAAVLGVTIAGADVATTSYPIAALAGSSPAAQDFVDYVAGASAAVVLTSAGFGTP
ncbi:molybdate ABC transporter substrate-binding protein [Demequina aurantiaca]|uniref:molybdate ABC transporter substrate-binding protein n=1 Tax=Demequina aurantiaca TaxID=676200 RepID=UPI003D33C5DF